MTTDKSRLESAIQGALLRLFARLPLDWGSAIGGTLVRWNVRRTRQKAMARARRNLAFHRPEATDAELDAMVDTYCDGIGRLMAEYAVLHRLLPEGRLEIVGVERYREIAGHRPLLALGLHTGNWETFPIAYAAAGIPLTSFYAPPADAFERRVAEATRARLGVRLLSPDPRGARDGLRALLRNEVVAIFPDEARDGRLMGPLFGRPPHDAGNIAVAARLARKSGALIGICHSTRLRGCRYRLVFEEPFPLPETDTPDLLADVAFLNAKIEPIISAALPNWYFLDDDMSPLP